MNYPSDDREVEFKVPSHNWLRGYRDDWMPDGAFVSWDYCVGDHPNCRDCNNSLCGYLFPTEWREVE